MEPRFADPSETALPLWLVPQGGDGPDFPPDAGEAAAAWAKSAGFKAKSGEICLIPGDGGVAGAFFGLGKPSPRPGRDRFVLARAADALPGGVWRLQNLPEGYDLAQAALGWLLSGYRFDRYKKAPAGDRARLICPDGVDAARIEALAAGEFLTRDLINTPANDLGPDALESAARAVADAHGMSVAVIAGEDLLPGFPMIHSVGRAGTQAPRLIDMRIGETGPTLTLVGKGVCFDTGGLNLKPGASMGLMKKDMGGAATVLGLTLMLCRLGVTDRIRLRVLLPVVENAVAGNAMRPGDVLPSRKGLTVEVNNTDAEGRLILGDALAYGAEDSPDLMISMATLTGAARVALGPDLPPFFCDDDATAAALAGAGIAAADPIWRLPFWEPYESLIEPGIADLDNAPSGGMAGAITAALFLRRFAEGAGRYVHFDIYGWRPQATPGAAKGGFGQGARAILTALPEILPEIPA